MRSAVGYAVRSEPLDLTLPPKYLTVVNPSRGRPSDADAGLDYFAIEDISAMAARVHPAFDHGLGVREPQSDVLRDATIGVADVPSAVTQ